MKLILFFINLFFCLNTFAHEDWSLKNFSVEKTMGSPFIKHETETPYLSFDLKPDQLKDILSKIDQFSYKPLKSRGEAHITVITPPEYTDDLSKFISIKEIDEIAEKLQIQKSSYTPVCLARGFATVENNKYLETYFVVVKSPDLQKIREEVAKVYQQRGGKKFDAAKFYPHITVGFTDRDLYDTDGVIKNDKLCMKTLHVSPLASHVPGIPVPNSFYVDKNKKGGALIRGNAPLNHHNLEAMKKFGVESVVIFKNDKAGEVRSEIGGLIETGMPQEKITHIDFDWKDNQDFTSGCKKIVHGIDLMNDAMKTNKKLFFHCTTGEDRTGVLAASYLLSKNKKTTIKKVFKSEMCAKGYEAGDPDKEKEVVERIRQGLTKTFLKTAYRIEEAKKKHLPIDENICAADPVQLKEFTAYSTQMNFTCGI